MPLYVIHVTDNRIYCSINPKVDYRDEMSATPIWEFVRPTGQEHDPEIVALMGTTAGYAVSHIEAAS
jgi:hypothetical protein